MGERSTGDEQGKKGSLSAKCARVLIGINVLLSLLGLAFIVAFFPEAGSERDVVLVLLGVVIGTLIAGPLVLVAERNWRRRLIGATAIALSIAALNRRGDRGKKLAISGLVLGAVTVVTCVWGIVSVDRALKEPNLPPASQSKPTMVGALSLSTLGK
jgi:hypothetical protein